MISLLTILSNGHQYGVKIFVITSFKDTCYIEILPSTQKSKRGMYNLLVETTLVFLLQVFVRLNKVKGLPCLSVLYVVHHYTTSVSSGLYSRRLPHPPSLCFFFSVSIIMKFLACSNISELLGRGALQFNLSWTGYV